METIYIEIDEEDGEVYRAYATLELATASLVKRGYEHLEYTEFRRLTGHMNRNGKPSYNYRYLIEREVEV